MEETFVLTREREEEWILIDNYVELQMEMRTEEEMIIGGE